MLYLTSEQVDGLMDAAAVLIRLLDAFEKRLAEPGRLSRLLNPPRRVGMISWTRPNRQVAATIALVLVTIAPTAYVAYTAWRINRPSHRHEVEAEISRVLGLQATLESLRYPRPGEVVYRGVILRQEEPRGQGLTEIARAACLRLRRGDRELMLEVDGLRVRADSPRAAMAQIGALLQRSGDAAYERVALSADDCQLDLGAGVAPYQLREVVAQFVTDADTPTVRASYRVVSGDAVAGTRCELALTRDRKSEPLRTTLTLKTMEGLPLPGACSIRSSTPTAGSAPTPRWKGR